MSQVAYDQDDGDRPPSFAGGSPWFSTLTRKLLWANISVWVATFLLSRFTGFGDSLMGWLHLDPAIWYRGLPALWQLWTFGFLHDLGSPTHILYNMIGLYFFGTMLEGQVGSRRFAWQYFGALAFGASVHLAFAPALGYPPVIGASGAVLYCVVACAVLQPNAQVIFVIVPMPLKIMALIFVSLDLFAVLSGAMSRTASDVHLAGAALGFAAARMGWVYFDPSAWRSARRVQRVQEVQASDEQRLDQLLERIHRDGIHTLSQRDKDFLGRMSKRG